MRLQRPAQRVLMFPGTSRSLLFRFACFVSLALLTGFVNPDPADAQTDAAKTEAETPTEIAFYRTGDLKNSADGVSRLPDGSQLEPPLDLNVDQPKSLKATSDGLVLSGRTTILTPAAATRLTRSLQSTGQVTLEAWLTPADRQQKGPARILTLSSDTSNRNFTLGQDGDRYDVRFRTSKTDRNGLPSLASPRGSVQLKLTHLVFTREKNGRTRIFLNGKQVTQGNARGNLSNWDGGARLSIGDEVGGGRPWKGRLYAVAIFPAALSAAKVRERFRGGWRSKTQSAPSPQELARAHFREKVAPLLANRCLECHDRSSAQGDLVLDRKDGAFESAIVSGKSEESPLWQSIEDDSMPHQRPPLNAAEKELVRQWIDSGAEWSLDWIDPADYLYDADTAENHVRRLTIDEYIRSVSAAVGVDISEAARASLPKDVRADGFSNTAYNLTVDLKHIEAYNRLAQQIVQQLDVRKFAKRFWGKARLTDDDMRGLISKMGAEILRGPLNESEIDLFRGISTSVASAGGSYEDAVAATIEAMLQSPRFLYRIENQLEDGTTDYIDDHQIASRISYAVWGSPPDDELRRAASDGELFDASAVARQVDRMLSDPRAVKRSEDFISQWLNLDHLDDLQPSPKRFPDWNAALGSQMKEETRAFFHEVVWLQKRPLAEILNAPFTYCRPELARHYGLTPKGEGLQRYDLAGNDQRGGLLTQGSVLTIGGDDASTVTRGLFVLNELLRGVVNDPPPCVDTTPVPTRSGVSTRTIAEARIKNEACGGCHVRFEPLAFGLEKFDGLGAFHQRDEHGNRLREDGSLLIPGAARPQSFETSAELMNRLAQSERVQETLVWKMAQFAAGRPLTSADAPTVRSIHRRASQPNATYQSILKEIVLSSLVTGSR